MTLKDSQFISIKFYLFFKKEDEEEFETASVSSDLSDILLEGDIEEENDKSTDKTPLTDIEVSGNVIT